MKSFPSLWSNLKSFYIIIDYESEWMATTTFNTLNIAESFIAIELPLLALIRTEILTDLCILSFLRVW
jgi:hypothetical protein